MAVARPPRLARWHTSWVRKVQRYALEFHPQYSKQSLCATTATLMPSLEQVPEEMTLPLKWLTYQGLFNLYYCQWVQLDTSQSRKSFLVGDLQFKNPFWSPRSTAQVAIGNDWEKTMLAQVMLVAADTFRAAAADQLQGWAERSGASLERPNSSKQRPDGVINMALDKVKSPWDCKGLIHFIYFYTPDKSHCYICESLRGGDVKIGVFRQRMAFERGLPVWAWCDWYKAMLARGWYRVGTVSRQSWVDSCHQDRNVWLQRSAQLLIFAQSILQSRRKCMHIYGHSSKPLTYAYFTTSMSAVTAVKARRSRSVIMRKYPETGSCRPSRRVLRLSYAIHLVGCTQITSWWRNWVRAIKLYRKRPSACPWKSCLSLTGPQVSHLRATSFTRRFRHFQCIK